MASVDRVGQELESRYRLVARALDRGSGACWDAVDARRDNAPVTVKFLRAVEGAALPPPLLAAIRARKVFRHDAVPTVLAHGLDGRTPWIVFDALQGDSLGTQLEASWAQGQALEPSHLRAVIVAVRDALRAAHTAPLPLFAGTIAPGAVLLRARATRGLVAALPDLGLWSWLDPPDDASAHSARWLVSRAPELEAGPVDARTDVFALAAWMTEILATPPVAGAQQGSVTADRHRDDVPTRVWSVLAAAMVPSPAERFAGVGVLGMALDTAWSSPVPAARSRLAAAAPAPAASGAPDSLLETIAPSLQRPPSLQAVLPTPAPAPAPATPLLSLPALPAAPTPALSEAPAVSPTRAPSAPQALEPLPEGDNPWATHVLQRSPPVPSAPRHTEMLDAESLLAEPRTGRRIADMVRDLPAPDDEALAQSTLVASRPVPAPEADDLLATLVSAPAPTAAPKALARFTAAPTPTAKPGPGRTVRLSDLVAEPPPQGPAEHLGSTLVAQKPRGSAAPADVDVTVPSGAGARPLATDAANLPLNVPSDTLIGSVSSVPGHNVSLVSAPPPPAPPAGRRAVYIVVAVLVAVVGILWGLR